MILANNLKKVLFLGITGIAFRAPCASAAPFPSVCPSCCTEKNTNTDENATVPEDDTNSIIIDDDAAGEIHPNHATVVSPDTAEKAAHTEAAEEEITESGESPLPADSDKEPPASINKAKAAAASSISDPTTGEKSEYDVSNANETSDIHKRSDSHCKKSPCTWVDDKYQQFLGFVKRAFAIDSAFYFTKYFAICAFLMFQLGLCKLPTMFGYEYKSGLGEGFCVHATDIWKHGWGGVRGRVEDLTNGQKRLHLWDDALRESRAKYHETYFSEAPCCMHKWGSKYVYEDKVRHLVAQTRWIIMSEDGSKLRNNSDSAQGMHYAHTIWRVSKCGMLDETCGMNVLPAICDDALACVCCYLPCLVICPLMEGFTKILFAKVSECEVFQSIQKSSCLACPNKLKECSKFLGCHQRCYSIAASINWFGSSMVLMAFVLCCVYDSVMMWRVYNCILLELQVQTHHYEWSNPGTTITDKKTGEEDMPAQGHGLLSYHEMTHETSVDGKSTSKSSYWDSEPHVYQWLYGSTWKWAQPHFLKYLDHLKYDSEDEPIEN